jgi:citronellol/citronellal dehydrogenase
MSSPAVQPSLKGRTLFITGATRGIGKAIGLRAARDGANVVVVGKTDAPHPKLEGTVHSAAEEIRGVGGRALSCALDIRNEVQVERAVERAIAEFGGIDILINNASAIALMKTDDVPMKRFDLMHQVNARGTFCCAKACHAALCRSDNPHVLTLSPPLDLDPKWFGAHLAYTLSKFSMSLCTLGLAEEWKHDRIAVNSLWPRTTIATAAIANLLGGQDALRHCRTPEIVADAAYAILTRPRGGPSGRFFLDEDVLREAGCESFDGYAVEPGAELAPDLFVR